MRGVIAIILLCVTIMAAVDMGFLSDKLSIQEIKTLGTDPDVTHKVVIEVSQIKHKKDSDEIQQLTIGEVNVALFGYTVPYTVHNFVHLSNMTYGYGYHKKTLFHRIIKNFMVQTGDYQYGEGYGGHSIYNNRGKFKDENFKLKHNRFGRLSMANGGPNSNGGQFFITTNEECSWLDGKHVVFGQVISGFDILDVINSAKTNRNDRPISDIVMSKVEVITLDANYDKNIKMSKVNDIGYGEIVESSTFDLTYYFIFLLFAAMVFILLKWYFKRQAIMDTKDLDYY